MPWNGSGTYSPPAASFPEVAGTLIDATRFNATINDIATGISNCLTLDGQNSPSADINMATFKFTNLGAGGAAGQAIIWGQTASMGIWLGALGSASAPAFSFASDSNTGIYSSGANILDFAIGGSRTLELNNGQILAESLGSAAAPTWSFRTDSNTGIYSSGSNIIDFAIGGTRTLELAGGQVLAEDLGSAASPTWSFRTDDNTGMYSPGGNTLAWAVGGTREMELTPVGVLLIPNQSAFYALTSATSAAGTNEATTYTTEVVDRQTEFVPATGRFTAEADGTYAFNFGVQTNSAAGSTVTGFLRINGAGTNYGIASIQSPGGTNSRAGGAAILTLTAGDYVSVWTTVSGGAATLVEYFGGHLIG